ncbi:nucleotide disphospho-sugar-binding domain-containing protein [Actinomadura opuntiae]|uniref:nucleotide disphospho-sugar-binding domain-containing protein n=1 Tax=Actinomadura sp. OS1-43 TaxID=604315 RepID=UPI00255B0ADB|nr:nucleotide disphospho-sugar-binding domain-containing protein [Actinomadura sp. OS1-43]MDL4815422.1 DUF1205 domain-containing protein [Actinomadura sp. OS1-43]
MHVLFTPFAQPNSFYGMVPLAWALRAAGHEVRVAAQPLIAGAVTASGLPFVPVGTGYGREQQMEEYRRNTRREDLKHAGTLDKFVALDPAEKKRINNEVVLPTHHRLAEAMAEELVPFARDWEPDLVVSDPLVIAGTLAAETVGAPLVRILWGPDLLMKMGFPGLGLAPEDWPDYLVALFEQYKAEMRADPAEFTLDPCPESMQSPGIAGRVAFRYIPYNGGPSTVPEWLRRPADRPRVCVSWSTVSAAQAGQEAEEFAVPAIIDALAGLDVEPVVTVGAADRDLLGPVPEGVRVVSEMPLNLLLPSCDLIIHHGGGGTMLTAAYHGVPQITVPKIFDQAFCARQLAGTGAGVSLEPGEADRDSMKAAAASALAGGGQADAARRLRDEMLAQPAPAAMVAGLEGLRS